ncbi:uncharacterized protein LOC141627813 [Silene latifolia]|uniref:uncharacterized protein LOC141627813 n=1 Tax=Silene latifolia TaxID=37657 RepID=UPI003D77BE69
MARLPLNNRKKIVVSCIAIYRHMLLMVIETIVELLCHLSSLNITIPKPITYTFDNSIDERVQARLFNIRPMIQGSDISCLDNLRMDRACFGKLCEMLRDAGRLEGNRNTSLEEMVALFLFILSHDTKNRRTQLYFRRSGETVSRHFNLVLRAILRCHHLLLKKPEPVTENCQDERWKWFKNCLGALDGTHIKVHVGDKDKVRFRTRKGDLTTNVLGDCTRDLQFVYILPGWEGSAHDNRVLRDALSRKHPLRVPQGQYYLCDAGYMNCEGFLTPFRGQRYHLSIWKNGAEPTCAEEYFNMKHSQARNVIERAFGLLKMRWGILRNATWYSRKTFSKIIFGCALVHNFIRTYMSIDPFESLIQDGEEEDDDNCIDIMETSAAWTQFRKNLADQMYNHWLQTRG